MRAKLVYTNGKPFTLTGIYIEAVDSKSHIDFVVTKPSTAIGGGVKVIPKEIVSVHKSDLMGYQIKNSRKGSSTTVCVSRSRLKELNEILSHA